MYNTAANAMMVAQEGQRRSHGFDYKSQVAEGKAQEADGARKRELYLKIMGHFRALQQKAGEVIDGDAVEVTAQQEK
jgi:hypothetical protein